MSDFLTLDYHSQPAIRHGQLRLIPFARSVRLRFPGLQGGFIWSKPSSLLVRYPDGQEQVLPVPDLTRRYILYILAAGLFGWLCFKWLEHRLQKQELSL